ncbi:MAG TPA: hypothetical protein DEP28_07460 [Bacteroidetes bacterium]|nr:hypothetical protein [Bacteroidota bacterium]
MRKEIKLLNFSDIHFKAISDDAVGIRNINYFEAVRNQIDTLKPTHIIINGDMVFSGKEEQFNACYNLIFNGYLEKEENKNVRLILAPGNHSLQRNIPQIFFDTLKKGKRRYKITEIKSIKGKIEFEKELGNIFQDKPRKHSLLEKFANELEKIDFAEELRNSDGMKISDYLFLKHQKFVSSKIIERFDNINKNCNNCIEYDTYKSSKGTHGVIFDREYNVIFSILNGVEYFWGKESYDKLVDQQIIDESFDEYGNLSFGISTNNVYNELMKLYHRNVLGHSIVCLLSHVPISWMSYESQYNSRSNFSYIMKHTDIAFFAHIHVEYFEPSIYRNRTYFFDSAQLFDHTFYEVSDDQIDIKIIPSLGFSYFKMFGDNSQFSQTHYKLIGKDLFKKNSLDKYDFEFEGEEFYYELKSKKGNLETCYDCTFSMNYKQDKAFMSTECGFYKYIHGLNLKIVDNQQVDNFCIKIFDNIYIDCKYLHIKEINESKPVTSYPSKNSIVPIKYGEKLYLYVSHTNKSKEIEEIFEEIINLICKSSTLLDSVSLIKVVFFDFSLYHLFYLDSRVKENSFQNWEKLLELNFVKFKSDLFAETNYSDNSRCDKIKVLSKIGIDIDVRILSEYESTLFKKNKI